MMRIYQETDYEAMSRRAANLISAEVIRRPDCVLGLATGSTRWGPTDSWSPGISGGISALKRSTP